MRIYLIGFMGSGKTSIGKRIAKILNYNFLDMDDYLERKFGKSIPDIFKDDGEGRFREMERETLHNTFEMKNVVIAAGGGTPCFFDNIEQINKYGVSYYLKRSVEFFVNKLLTSKTERTSSLKRRDLDRRSTPSLRNSTRGCWNWCRYWRYCSCWHWKKGKI